MASHSLGVEIQAPYSPGSDKRNRRAANGIIPNCIIQLYAGGSGNFYSSRKTYMVENLGQSRMEASAAQFSRSLAATEIASMHHECGTIRIYIQYEDTGNKEKNWDFLRATIRDYAEQYPSFLDSRVRLHKIVDMVSLGCRLHASTGLLHCWVVERVQGLQGGSCL